MTELIIRYAEPSAEMDRTVIPREVVGTLVRCKDCEYKRLMDDGETKYYYCALKAHEEWSVDDTDFCSWGEMKGGDDE